MGRAPNHLRWPSSTFCAGLPPVVKTPCTRAAHIAYRHVRCTTAASFIVTGSGATWTAQVTAEGTRRMQQEAKRIDAERERARREEK